MTKPQVETYLIGVDLGTSSCKSVVMDSTGSVLGSGAALYPAEDMHSQWEEQDPESLVTATIIAVREAIDSAGVPPDACTGLSVGGALHSLIALDGRDRPLTGVITWADNRAAPQATALRNTHDVNVLYRQTGCPVHSMYPLAKIIWLREERPQIFDKAEWFISSKEYVTLRLTGSRVVDYAIAGASGLLDTHALTWSEQALELADIEPGQLFELTDPLETIGKLNTDFAAAMGVGSTAPLILGSGDAVNSSIGAGAVLEQQVTCMVGSSGALRVISSEPMLDPQERSWCYSIDSQHWLVGGAINNGGLALEWLRDALNQGSAALSRETALSFNELIDWAAQIEPGAQGLLCLPFLTGERSPHWNPNARAVLFGLTLQHDQRHIARAVLEGVCFRLRSVLDVINETIGEPQEVRASGGFTRSRLWLQVAASVLDQEILVPSWGETSSLGAAFWAMLGAGHVSTLEELGGLVEVATSYLPVEKETRIYSQLYAIYEEIYTSLRGAFDKMGALQANFFDTTSG